jgi:hypothetical protein
MSKKTSKTTPAPQSPDRENRVNALDTHLRAVRGSIGAEYHEAYVAKVHEERRARKTRATLARTVLSEARAVENAIECAASDPDIRHTPIACTVDVVRCDALALFNGLYARAEPGRQYLYVQDGLDDTSVVINALICPRANKAAKTARPVRDQILTAIGEAGVRVFFSRFVPVASQRIDMDFPEACMRPSDAGLPSECVRILGDKGNHAVFSKNDVIGDWSTIGRPAVEYYIIGK